jgi:Ca-activated chloride channel family protein
MTFAAPLALIGLLALPALVGCYLVIQSRRRRAAGAFANAALLPSVAPKRPRWRRQATLLAYLLALGLLLVALAGPRVATATPERLQTMLAIDVSGSMAATDVKPNRITAAQHAADLFVTKVPAQVKIGVMQFDQVPEVLALPTVDRTTVFRALGSLRVRGGTAIGEALRSALAILSPGSRDRRYAAPRTAAGRARAVIVLVSDGKSTNGVDPVAVARRARALHIPIFTVALGTPDGTISVRPPDENRTVVVRVPPDPAALAQIARASGGRSYTARDAERLGEIYKRIGQSIARHSERRDVTSDFLAAALAAGLLGGLASLGWFGRLI